MEKYFAPNVLLDIRKSVVPQRCVERALHAAQGNKRRSHEQGAESDLNTEEKIAKSETTKNDRASPPALHHLRGVCRPDLPHGNQAPQHATSDRQQQSHRVDLWIGADGHMNRKFWKRLPMCQCVQQIGRKK